MNIKISLNIIVKPILWVAKYFTYEKRGDGDDWGFYTGLRWGEDKNND